MTLCRRLRQQGNPVPVLMLTALGETADLVTGLEAGADRLSAQAVRVRGAVRACGHSPGDRR